MKDLPVPILEQGYSWPSSIQDQHLIFCSLVLYFSIVTVFSFASLAFCACHQRTLLSFQVPYKCWCVQSHFLGERYIVTCLVLFLACSFGYLSIRFPYYWNYIFYFGGKNTLGLNAYHKAIIYSNNWQP